MIWCAPLPSLLAIQRYEIASDLRYNNFLPSADSCGAVTVSAPLVMATASPPATGTIHRFEAPALLEEKIISLRLVQRTSSIRLRSNVNCRSLPVASSRTITSPWPSENVRSQATDSPSGDQENETAYSLVPKLSTNSRRLSLPSGLTLQSSFLPDLLGAGSGPRI